MARAAAALAPGAFRSLTLLSSGPARVARPQRIRVRVLRAALAVLSKERVWQAMCWLDSRGEEPDTGDTPELTAFLRRRWTRTRIAQLAGAGRLLLDRQDGTEQLAALPCRCTSRTGRTRWSGPRRTSRGGRPHRRAPHGGRGRRHSPNVSHPRS
ncbi:hypothetical protein O1L60_25460 [Streptomyces diastatochromogenes]|nr:hypothetical protein [Streptomyces diastatochromogenes]